VPKVSPIVWGVRRVRNKISLLNLCGSKYGWGFTGGLLAIVLRYVPVPGFERFVAVRPRRGSCGDEY
jgi:hypothetical protein